MFSYWLYYIPKRFNIAGASSVWWEIWKRHATYGRNKVFVACLPADATSRASSWFSVAKLLCQFHCPECELKKLQSVLKSGVYMLYTFSYMYRPACTLGWVIDASILFPSKRTHYTRHRSFGQESRTDIVHDRPKTNRMMGDVVPVRFFGPFAHSSEKPVDLFVGFDVGQKNASEVGAINFTTGILIAGGRWTAGPMTWWNNSTEPFLEFRHQVTQTCPTSDQRVLLSIIEITQAEERLVLDTARNTVLWQYYLGLFQELLILPTGEMHRQILKPFVDLRAWMISAGAGMRRI